MATIRTRARGELEGEILRILREDGGELSAIEIQPRLTGHPPAYTTVMTALERLHKKGEVVRSSDSPRRIRFRAARSGEENASATMLSALDGAGDRRAALLSFAGNLDPADVELLRAAIGKSDRREPR
jgi:predicted transcriptional regulator